MKNSYANFTSFPGIILSTIVAKMTHPSYCFYPIFPFEGRFLPDQGHF